MAHILDANGSDQAQFAPLLDAIKANLKRNPQDVSADAGYCSATNLRTLGRRRINGYIATGRQKHGATSATAERRLKPGSLLARMSAKLRRAGHRSRYRLRKQVVEPVFGQIKQARAFRQFLLRGRESEGRTGHHLHRTQPGQARRRRMTTASPSYRAQTTAK